MSMFKGNPSQKPNTTTHIENSILVVTILFTSANDKHLCYFVHPNTLILKLRTSKQRRDADANATRS